jgi:hypothetical protein
MFDWKRRTNPKLQRSVRGAKRQLNLSGLFPASKDKS